jgi:hypothetical protein
VTLQSWPGIVHGGAATGLLDAVATAGMVAAAPRTVEVRLTSSLPLDTTLELDGHADDGTARLTVRQGGQTLTSGAIGPLGASDRGRTAAWAGGDEGWTLPMSEHCLACGALNPIGLRVGLRFDRDGVWARIRPRPPWRSPGDRLHPALAPVVLDEVAWWLGALVMKEGGLTNRLRVALLVPDGPWDAPLVAAGRFDTVAAVDRRRAFWRTESALMTADGVVLARASIVFRGGAEYSGRQVEYFRSRTAPDVFRRMFPNYAG